MGIPVTGADFKTTDKRFSSDVLKIEIAGPLQHHLSVVDVPGKSVISNGCDHCLLIKAWHRSLS